MRAIITSFGTAGCTQPVLALAVEMRRCGHDVTLALPTQCAKRVQRMEFDFVALGPDLEDDQPQPFPQITELTANPDMYNSLEYMSSLAAPLANELPQVFARLKDACSKADVLISKASQPASRMVHELTGIPFAAFHTFYLPGSSTQLGSEGTQTYRQITETFVNRFRKELGLPPLSDPLTRNGDSPQLTMIAMSRHVISQPDDWPAHYHMPGYFFLDEMDWRPAPSLVRFINSGEPPVVISFGSMQHSDPESLMRLLMEAVSIAGCRAIIQTCEPTNHKPPPNALITGQVPHSWLFPRAACVVHHGGAGTTAATLRACVPSVFVPHTYDQPIWAEILRQLGCAGPAIPFAELTPEWLGCAIASTLCNRSYYEAVSALSAKVRDENGVEKARLLIEELAG